MDATEVVYNPNPREGSNIFSTIFFGYTFPTFRKGLQKELGVEDVYNTLKADRSNYIGDRLERNWNKQLEMAKKNPKRTPSLLKAIIQTFWLEYLFLGILMAISDLVFKTSQPYVLGGILDYYTPGSHSTKFEAYMYGIGLIAFTLGNSLLLNQYVVNSGHSGIRVGSSVCALVYRKATRLSRTAFGNATPGQVVNLLSNDVARFDFASIMIHQLWIGPISGILVMVMLYQRSGIPGIAGILVIVIMAPVQAYSGKLAARFRKMTAMKTDERIRIMDEVIVGIQVIKMYAWEIPFQKIVNVARKAEVKVIRTNSYIRALFTTLGMLTTRVALFATLLTITLTGDEITAAMVFVLMSYFNILSQTLIGIFVRGVSVIAELMISVERLQDFLLNEEYKYEQFNSISSSMPDDSKAVLRANNLIATWNKSNSDNVLTNINLDINKGKLIGIIGPVGCGKSSLLQTFLGELDIVQGSLNVKGKFSYASQEPWIFAATIQQNILFGSDYHKKRYKTVLRVCALNKDLKQFPQGDMTIVGDKGASLSGGQKARINLARAVYRDADIYLLDDPLSAVDIHVSKVLYEECINKYLAKKTRILVTHQVHYLKNADRIYILNNGRIETEGTFSELASSDNLYAKLLTSETDLPREEGGRQIEFARQVSRYSTRSNKSLTASIGSTKSFIDSLMIEDYEDTFEEYEHNKPDMIDMQEETTQGKVFGSLLLQYLKTGANCCNMTIVIILYFTVQITGSLVDYFISVWTSIEESRLPPQLNSTFTPIHNNFTNITNATVTAENPSWYPDWSTQTCLYIYGGLLLVVVFFTLGRAFSFYFLAMRCSQKLHEVLFNGIINAKMRFFDTNPSGRILNRFAKDIGNVDDVIPRTLLDGGEMFLQIIGSLVLVGIANPYAIALAIVLALFTILVRNIYLRTSKNLRRVVGILRSPIYTHLNATLQGIATVRAFRIENVLKDEFDKIQDYYISASFMNIGCGSAFGFSLDFLSCIFTTALVFTILTFDEAMGLTGSAVGLAISQALSLTGLIQIAIRTTADISNQMMSVERVLEYKQLPPEPQPDIPMPVPKKWPDAGKIKFEGLKLRYTDDGPFVIKNLNLKIKAQEKVGIVGRTGAGKTSLISALFRLSNIEGKIIIDRIDTQHINLKDLRSKISIIPQDPVLFSGTLRYNLDPFGNYADEELYSALEKVELKDPNNVINRLDSVVFDKGSNYSVGQRQLVCLARAIIRKNKILVLDEATANVDPQTDSLIQKTLRTKFADCTVLTIAHRLNTIMDSDKVLVMDQGEVAEFDHPHLLLQNEYGTFTRMVEETGRGTAEQLKKIAEAAYQHTLALKE